MVMGRNLFKLTKSFDEVIVIIILMCGDSLKSERFSLRVFVEYLKNGSTDFFQTSVII